SRSGGGPMFDLGVHVIDLVRYLMGNPKPVSVYGATFQKLFDRNNLKDKKAYVSVSKSYNDICDVEDLATAMIRFDNGAVLSIEASFSLNTKSDEGKIELFGTKGGAKLDPELEMYSEINDYMANVELTTKTALTLEGIFEEEINHFADCIQNGVPCRAPAEDGVTLMSILDAVYESARTGHEVVL
ncbi:MAG: Gfo/Idh/MocA family oxidoreductase, partial [Clostridia bacterium]|nr:Gfo/Idh/MocA family oxidoreductase [Clostridia bacterium]